MPSENVLGTQRVPRFFHVADAPSVAPPAPRRATAVRTVVRSLAGMQKEAVVASSDAPGAWRLVSDEGPYLDGHDEAPFPLAFLTAGTAASYLTELRSLAEQRDVPIDGLRLMLDHRYTMEGSAVRGTMVGGALPPEIRVLVPGADTVVLRGLVSDAVDASPLNGLLRAAHTSRFTLTSNGRRLALDRVARLPEDALPDPSGSFADLEVGGPSDAEALMRRIRPAEEREGEGGKGSSLRAEQQRTLHVAASGVIREDGIKQLEVALRSPLGSTFRFLSDEPGHGRPIRAPDAATLISAGIGFCFMTQFGRYAAITRKVLDRYVIVQDTHFSAGGASAGTGRPGEADPVDTHVHLETPEDDGFARTLVDMGEQTCFLHALCRTPLKPRITVAREDTA